VSANKVIWMLPETLQRLKVDACMLGIAGVLAAYPNLPRATDVQESLARAVIVRAYQRDRENLTNDFPLLASTFVDWWFHGCQYEFQLLDAASPEEREQMKLGFTQRPFAEAFNALRPIATELVQHRFDVVWPLPEKLDDLKVYVCIAGLASTLNMYPNVERDPERLEAMARAAAVNMRMMSQQRPLTNDFELWTATNIEWMRYSVQYQTIRLDAVNPGEVERQKQELARVSNSEQEFTAYWLPLAREVIAHREGKTN